VELRITIPRNATVNALQIAIQNELASPFQNIPLDLRQIYYPGSTDERRMQQQALISDYFNGNPPEDLYHVVASPIPPPPNN
ncbi:6312_t:CDS:1, partial [Diversispora eburnea]